MLKFLKAIFLGTEPDLSELPAQAQLPFQPVFANFPRQQGVPTELLRRGWLPHQFGTTPFVIALPRQYTVRVAADGTLQAATDKPQPELTAKLHVEGFDTSPLLAHEFVADQAQQRGVPVHQVGLALCYYDPTLADPFSIALRTFVIGLPGGVIALQLWGTRETAATPLLNEVRQMVPHLVGRLR